MKIVSWNVNGIRAIVKKGFLEDIQQMDPDILCLQETKAQPEQVEEAIKEIKNYSKYYNSADKKGYSSTAILSKIEPISITNDMGVPEHDKEGRVICAEYKDFYLVTVYVPNSGQGLKRLDYRQQWDVDFTAYLKNLEKTKPVIVCGDLNVAHTSIDLKNDKSNYNKSAGYTQVEIDGFQALLDAGFVDTFRLLHPEEVKYTYWSYRFNARKNNSGWRIDYFLVSQVLADKVKSAEIHNEYFGSDHCPVSIEVEL
ncbi:MAG TPA: exodeoxyribonuclease III [Saprospiraceae bacterium]|nr:exodeoxyribonuclease III [Saprospiraceae bacterium]